MTTWFSKMMAQRRINNLLRELGSNSREVANVLLHMGIRGERAVSNSACPLAVFLKQQGYSVSVGKGVLHIAELDHYVWMPEACTQFVNDFDEGAYPYLVK